MSHRPRRRLASPVWLPPLALLLALAGGGQPFAQGGTGAGDPPVAIAITSQAGNASATLDLTPASPLSYKLESERRELLLRFSGEIQVPRLDALPAKLSDWLAAASAGYDTLLFVASRDVQFHVASRNGGIEITMTAANAATASAKNAGAAARAQHRLDLLQSQVLIAQGRYSEARRLLLDLNARNPGDSGTLEQLGQLEEQTDRWRRALAYYGQSLAADPRNEDVAADLVALERTHGSFLGVQPEIRLVKGLDHDYFFNSGGVIRITPAVSLIANLDDVHTDTPSVLLPTGETTGFVGDRQRSELGLQYDWEDGDHAEGLVFGNRHFAGAGGSYTFVGLDGSTTTLAGYYRQPIWDFIEEIVNDGYRSRVRIEHKCALFSWLDGRLAANGNWYGEEGISNAATTVSVDGNLNLKLPNLAAWSLVYTLEAEYVTDQKTLTGPSDNAFQPLELTNREVHALTIDYSDSWAMSALGGRTLAVEAYAGGGMDRYGKAGPLVGATATLRDGGPVDIQIRGDYVRNIGRDRETSTTIGGYLNWHF